MAHRPCLLTIYSTTKRNGSMQQLVYEVVHPYLMLSWLKDILMPYSVYDKIVLGQIYWDTLDVQTQQTMIIILGHCGRNSLALLTLSENNSFQQWAWKKVTLWTWREKINICVEYGKTQIRVVHGDFCDHSINKEDKHCMNFSRPCKHVAPSPKGRSIKSFHQLWYGKNTYEWK